MVKPIVPDILAGDPLLAKVFYGDMFGLEVKMDLGRVVTMDTDTPSATQITFASHGGGENIPVPDLTFEVDDFDEVLKRDCQAGFEHKIEYDPVNEPWGVKRFFSRDPFGKLINVMVHL